jgi:hypothetical protein
MNYLKKISGFDFAYYPVIFGPEHKGLKLNELYLT